MVGTYLDGHLDQYLIPTYCVATTCLDPRLYLNFASLI